MSYNIFLFMENCLILSLYLSLRSTHSSNLSVYSAMGVVALNKSFS